MNVGDLTVRVRYEVTNPEALAAIGEAAGVLDSLAHEMPWRAEVATALERLRFAALTLRVSPHVGPPSRS